MRGFWGLRCRFFGVEGLVVIRCFLALGVWDSWGLGLGVRVFWGVGFFRSWVLRIGAGVGI